MTDLSEEEERAWRGFQHMSTQVGARLHRSLLANSGISLPDFEVLHQLAEAPDSRMRGFELGTALHWEKSRLSHHLRRMENRGLVERQTCDSDGRGLWLSLTDTGRKALAEAAPQHVADLRALLIDHLSPDQLRALAELSEKVLADLPSDLCDT